MQAVFQIVNCHILVAIEAYQIVAITFVVAEEEVFAMHRAILAPILLCNLDSRRLGMKIDLVFYIVRLQKVKHSLTA